MPVIMTRGEDGEVRLLMNRCRHWGNVVCQYESGNSMFFRCSYHGWVYKNDGKLAGVPWPEVYPEGLLDEIEGLVSVPRMSIYRGMVFGNLSPEGMSLDEHLGEPAKEMIDLFMDLSPVGEIAVRAGVHKGYYKGNWKFVGMDNYHTSFVHKSLFDVRRRRSQMKQQEGDSGMWGSSRSSGRRPDHMGVRDLGNGHVMNDHRFNDHNWLPDTDWAREYRSLMEKAYGKERAGYLIRTNGDPHMHVWPNIQIIDVHIRVMQPLRADFTDINMYPCLLKGVPPEINELRLRKHESFYGPASGGNPDDYEVFERNQIGLQSEVNPWVLTARGIGQEVVNPDGTVSGPSSAETTTRGRLRRWKEEMMKP
jgi:phenylpropionate dioxygenase-like ring-hydroxylating dioxygenase large terminal subunit